MHKIFLSIYILIFSFSVLGKSLKLASVLRLNDLYHHYPKDILRGLEFSLKENASDWLIEHKIFPHDGSIENMSKVVAQIEAYHPDVIIGGETSQMALYLNSKLNKYVFISPTASTDQLFWVNNKSFRMTQSDGEYVRAVKFLLKNRSFKNIGLIHNISNPNTKKIGDQVISFLKSNNLNFSYVITQNGVQTKKSDLRDFISKKVDIVIAFTYETDLRNIFLLLSDASVNPTYLGADGWGRDEDLKKSLFVNKILDFNSYRTSYWNPDRKDKFFKNKTNQLSKFLGKSPNQFHAIGYDTGKLIIKTLENIDACEEFEHTFKNMKIDSLLTSKDFHFNNDNSPSKDLYLYNLSTKDSMVNYLRID